MVSQSLGLNSSVIDTRKLFCLLALFEFVTMVIVLVAEPMDILLYFVVVLMPVFLLLLPIEPLLGVPFIFIATGFDFFAQITKSAEHEYRFTYFHIIMVVTFASIFLNHFLKRRVIIPSCSLWAPVIAFLSLLAVTLIYTPNFFYGFMEFIRLAVLCAFCFAFIICVNTISRVKIVVWSYILVPFGSALYTFYEIVTEGEFYKSQIIRVATELGLKVYRSTGTFHNPNDLACFLMIGIIIGFGLLFVRKGGFFIKLFILSTIGVTSVAIIATFSRAGWLSTICAVFLIVYLNRRWSYLFLLGGLLVLMLAFVAVRSPEIVLSAVHRFSMIFSIVGEASASARLSLIRMGLWMWQDHPVFGVGAGGFAYLAYDYLDPNMPRALLDVVFPHTLQAKILAEEGLIGITIAVWFFVTVVFEGIRSVRRISNEYLKTVEISLLALFVAYIINFTFAADLHNNIFWITVSMIYAVPLVDLSIARSDGENSRPAPHGDHPV